MVVRVNSVVLVVVYVVPGIATLVIDRCVAVRSSANHGAAFRHPVTVGVAISKSIIFSKNRGDKWGNFNFQFLIQRFYTIFAAIKRSCGRVARQSSAKASTAVRIRSGPPTRKGLQRCDLFCFRPRAVSRMPAAKHA